nr:immunoglobulin light chain junction region [Macaca mulatta]MOW66225.1 immunoglobulin light chain junction region [Macaca mulatta]MOW66543.1 immunoglobulin light chain junction region [Macaca mulatta]MOW66758.1 immunoglobulin light chain junction region [Macaca mulatta]MOW67127.1 immunoglobulin light chain junction region [Macaca mulatta]
DYYCSAWDSTLTSNYIF